MDNILSLVDNTPDAVSRRIALRVKSRRLELNLTQEGMATRAGIKLPTYRQFERTGMISLKGLLHIAFVLDAMDDFDALFVKKQYVSLDELVSSNEKVRKRGKKNE